jgi:chromosome segregation ATPase
MRRDPRAEPDTPAPATAEPRTHATDRPGRQEVIRERRPSSGHVAPTSATRAASTARLDRASPAADEAQAASAQESNASLGVAGAMGLASLRRQLATLQMNLAEAQGQLANEQQGRAEDADALAALLERVTNTERVAAEAAGLRGELEREREFVEELRVSVREKYEDCNTLRQRLADADNLVAKERGETAERTEILERQLHEATTQLEGARANEEAQRTEREALFTQLEGARASEEAQRTEREALFTQLEGARASEEAQRTELAALSAQLEERRRAQESLDGELQKTNAALKTANMKAFATNKQLESWKIESQRKIDQERAEHQAAVESLQREILQGTTAAAALRKQVDGAASVLETLARSLDALDQRESEMESLRELAQGARRAATEQTARARKVLASGAEPETASSPPPVISVATPGSLGLATLVPGSTSAAVRAARPPPIPLRAAPSSTKPAVEPIAAPTSSPEMEKAWDTPSLEIGETEMRAEDLVEELLEAQNRDQTRDR